MAAKPKGPKHIKSYDAPKKQLSLGPAYDKHGYDLIVETFGCGATTTEEDIKTMIKEAKTPVTLHVYAVGHAKAIQEINYVVENFLNEGGVFHGAIEVYGQEFSFGGCRQNKSGIFACKPKCVRPRPPSPPRPPFRPPGAHPRHAPRPPAGRARCTRTASRSTSATAA